MKKWLYILVLQIPIIVLGQGKFEFDGQLSSILSYSPNEERELFTAFRYLPELNYKYEIDSSSFFDFELSANINAVYNFSTQFPLNNIYEKGIGEGNVSPYRAWVRYSRQQFEIRAGLQKIEFGSSAILRPLQWFNQIDPRDPLQLTNGVYGVLGRYYFLNNANIWVWGLYGNTAQRGFDYLETNGRVPEVGGRLQYPIPKGEIGLTYHNRTVDSPPNPVQDPEIERIPEHRIGLDGKWDLGVGIWFEVSHLWKQVDLGPFTNQSAFNLGLDYTFGIANGLGFIAEHMIFSFDENPMEWKDPFHFTAATLSYPIGFFDSISSVIYYNWTTNDPTFFINYQHQFSKFDMYIMGYYNPENQGGIQQNELVYSFTGPGLRVMLVYNH